MDNADRIKRAIDYIEENIKEEISAAKIANYCGVSQFHLQRIFQSMVGDPLSTYIRQRRLSLAMEQLLKSSDKIIDIALEYRFNSHEAFIHAFKSYFNMSPRAMRKSRASTGYYERFSFIDPEDLRSNRLEIVEKCTLPNKIYGERINYSIEDFRISRDIIRSGRKLGSSHSIKEFYLITNIDSGNKNYITLGGERACEGLIVQQIPRGRRVFFKYRGSPRRILNSVKFLINNWGPKSLESPVNSVIVKYPEVSGALADYHSFIVLILS